MNLYVKNNPFWFELENLTRLYFPNEKITVYKEFDSVEKPFVYAEVFDEIRVRVSIGAFDRELTAALGADKNETELHTVQLLYRLLRDFSGVSQPWGLLTGVRPIKLLRKLSQERGQEEAQRMFSEEFFVSGGRVLRKTNQSCSRSQSPNLSASMWESRFVRQGAAIARLLCRLLSAQKS